MAAIGNRARAQRSGARARIEPQSGRNSDRGKFRFEPDCFDLWMSRACGSRDSSTASLSTSSDAKRRIGFMLRGCEDAGRDHPGVECSDPLTARSLHRG